MALQEVKQFRSDVLGSIRKQCRHPYFYLTTRMRKLKLSLRNPKKASSIVNFGQKRTNFAGLSDTACLIHSFRHDECDLPGMRCAPRDLGVTQPGHWRNPFCFKSRPMQLLLLQVIQDGLVPGHSLGQMCCLCALGNGEVECNFQSSSTRRK